MVLRARRTGSADYGRWIKCLIAGEPGVGKTLFGSTWPAPLYLNCEGGLMSVADRDVLAVDVEDSQTLLESIVALRQEPAVREKIFGGPVETVVLDTVDELARLLQRERLTETKKETLAQADWGWYGDQLRGIIRGLRNLDCHLILTVHVKTQEDTDSGSLMVKPSVQGAVGDELAGYVDLALLMRSNPTQRVVDGEIIRETARVLQSYGTNRYPWVKDRSGKLPPEFSVNFDDDYKRIDQVIFGGRDVPAAATQVIETIEPIVEEPPIVDAPPAVPIVEPAAETPVVDSPVVPSKTRTPRAKKEPPPPGVDPATGVMEESLLKPDETETLEVPASEADDPHPPLPEAAVVEPPKNKMGLPDDGPPWKCADCGEDFDDPDQAALSMIRFRRRLDGKCFRAAKSAKK